MQQGGFLSREFFEDMLSSHPSLGGMGGQVGWAQRGSTKPLNGTPWALSYAMGSDVLISTLWRRDLMELAFVGNASPSENNIFGPARACGSGRSTASPSVWNMPRHVSASSCPWCSVWPVPNGASPVAGSASQKVRTPWMWTCRHLVRRVWTCFPTPQGLSFQDVLPAYGVGISGALPWTSDVLPVQFVVNFRDIGVLFERPGGLYAAMDTGFTTTGLRVPFTSYFNQTGEEIDDLTWQDIVDGNAEISGDSIAFLTDSAARRTLLLPCSHPRGFELVAFGALAAARPSPRRRLDAATAAHGGLWVDAFRSDCPRCRCEVGGMGRHSSRDLDAVARVETTRARH